MSQELCDLLLYLKENKQSFLLKKIAVLISKSNSNPETVKFAKEHFNETMEIDLQELESLINPDKFKFPEAEIGTIGLENETDI